MRFNQKDLEIRVSIPVLNKCTKDGRSHTLWVFGTTVASSWAVALPTNDPPTTMIFRSALAMFSECDLGTEYAVSSNRT